MQFLAGSKNQDIDFKWKKILKWIKKVITVKKEWKMFYDNNQLYLAIKDLCPNAPLITEEKDLTNLYHFLSSFASDSGNVPSCN